MITLLSTILGFASSMTPDLLGVWRQHKDSSQELAILRLQIEREKAGLDSKAQAIEMQSWAAESAALYTHASSALRGGSKWITNLVSSVRPVLTYLFFALFASVKGAQVWAALSAGASGSEALLQVWDAESQAVFGAIVGFWFGQRALHRARGG